MRLIRYTTARTKKALMAEIANPASRDHGTGCGFAGLVCGVLGRANLDHLADAEAMRCNKRDMMYCYDDAADLAGYLECQGCGTGRIAWLLDVDDADVIGLAGRRAGGLVTVYVVDGVCLRAGAPVAARRA